MAYLNLASIRLCTESEGPGKRLAIWVQGCERRCPGCCNFDMQEIRKNIIVDAEDLIELIQKSMSSEKIEGLSFIGGEPMLQAEGLSEVAKWAHSVGLTVLVFTGYLYKELIEMKNRSVDKLISNVDILVDGPFIQELYDDERDWIGSKNQAVHFLTKAYESGIEFEKREHQMEVLISEKDILVNGWPY
ncbi:MAG: radical SAM protein [Eubacterium sp.]|nr:radical SAM protein [Eubacterium sp.]